MKRIIGFLLLFIGLALIFGTLYYSYNIFTGKSEPPEVFKVPQAQISQGTKSPTQGNLQDQIGAIVQENIKNVFPAEYFMKLFNLISWGMFAWILIMAGSVVSGAGAKILKN
jgi:hypothetical protein